MRIAMVTKCDKCGGHSITPSTPDRCHHCEPLPSAQALTVAILHAPAHVATAMAMEIDRATSPE